MTPAAHTQYLHASGLRIGYRHSTQQTCVAEALELALLGGEFTCLLGPNGAGKSTLIRTLAGIQAPLAGTLQLQGQHLHTLPPRARARKISIVLTEALPIGIIDAYSLVALGRHPYSGRLGGLNADDRARIEWAFQVVDATDLKDRAIAELSDGERQKIAIARALAQDAQIMLLDEPTAFLDLPRRVELMTLLRTLAHQERMALLLSTHDLELALRFADRLWLMMPDGQFVQGAPETLALNGQFAQAFSSQDLDWDPTSGSFRVHPMPCLLVYINGHGIEYIWTQRALERLGFGLTDDPNAAVLSIVISQTTWHVKHLGIDQQFESIEGLIEWIQGINWGET